MGCSRYVRCARKSLITRRKRVKTLVMSPKKSHHTQKEGENAGDEHEKVTSPAERGENAGDAPEKVPAPAKRAENAGDVPEKVASPAK